MADQIKPESLPAKRKLALTEDEHALIESYRQKNLAVDAFNKGIAKAIEAFEEWAYSNDAIVEDRSLGDAQVEILTKRLLAMQLPRISVL